MEKPDILSAKTDLKNDQNCKNENPNFPLENPSPSS